MAARWWLDSSGGKVHMVLLIKNTVTRTVKKLVIEKWEISETENPQVTRDHDGPAWKRAMRVRKVEIKQCFKEGI